MYKCFLSIVFSFLVLPVLSQKFNIEYSAEYDYYMRPDSTQPSRKIDPCVLLIGESGSVFLTKNTLIADSIINAMPKDISVVDALAKRASLPKSDWSHKIIKSYTNPKLYLQTFFIMSTCRVEDEAKMDWTLSSDTMMFKGLELKKATTHFRGRDYTAWYCPAIPIPDGPHKFRGLPGLIFDVYDTKKDYHFTLLSFNVENGRTMPIDYDSKVQKRMTRSEYLTERKHYEENRIAVDESMGIRYPEETKRLLIERLKENKRRRNNPMELE